MPAPVHNPFSPSKAVSTVDKLHRQAIAALTNEMHNLLEASKKGKLSCSEARDLRDYTSALANMKKMQLVMVAEKQERRKARLAMKTEEELEAALDKPCTKHGTAKVRACYPCADEARTALKLTGKG